MTEREAIVSWLREEWAWQRDESIKAAKCETLGRLRAAVFHAERAETLMYLISAIECGDHIRETEHDSAGRQALPETQEDQAND